jgi:hypothetical protein
MASPYTADERAQIFEILGYPLNGTTLQLIEAQMDPGMSSTFKPTFNTGDFSNWVTAIDAQLATNTTEQATRARVHLTRWVAIGPFNPLRVTSGATGAGVLVDFKQEREAIRKGLSSVIGIICPWGPLAEQAEQYYGKSRASCGDR